LPDLVAADELQGSTCVVIDVLRATTTITYALATGAARVIPCLEVDEAHRLASQVQPRPLLGGERGGVRIKDFDLGNSPSEYAAQRVTGKTLVFTTTNGTKAMQRARQAKRVLLGAFVNFGAVTAALSNVESIQVLCAGTQNQITREDVLLAGAIVDRLGTAAPSTLNDSARIAQAAWREVARGAESPQQLGEILSRELRDTQGGRNLIHLGLEADLIDCAAIDRFAFAPELDLQTWEIRKPF
jgi:2-phosphosulfolactate phosphatase